MANRLVGNLYILDSQEAATIPLPWPANAKVMAFSFWAASTRGELVLTMGNASNQVCHFGYNIHSPVVADSNTLIVSADFHKYLGGVNFSPIAVTTLTAGTGWIYFG